jgi:hypothetical protein
MMAMLALNLSNVRGRRDEQEVVPFVAAAGQAI